MGRKAVFMGTDADGSLGLSKQNSPSFSFIFLLISGTELLPLLSLAFLLQSFKF